MADLAQAYVQIIPSTKGIGSAIGEALGGGDVAAAASNAGASIAEKIKGAIAAAGIGAAISKFFSSAIEEGGKLQQSIGGVETLFKESASTVENYAKQAYSTVGISANEYMEEATSFSAALVSSLGGDTAKAAEVANTAIVDMGDNANKMGTSMGDIQNAYQGFAKQNYTMLDNLKLGKTCYTAQYKPRENGRALKCA